MLRRLTWLLIVIATLWAGPAPIASAASKGRQLPDLRRAPTSFHLAPSGRIHIPLTVHVAADSKGAVISQRQLVWWVARTNRALIPYGIEVSLHAVAAVPSDYNHVTRWRERRGLATLAPKDGTIHVFVVSNVDVGGRHASGRRIVRGMHWRYRGARKGLKGREYVVVADHAPSTTLAHEVGHLFGLRHHGGDKNLMCSCREGPGQSFTTSQGSNMRGGARRFLSRQRRR